MQMKEACQAILEAFRGRPEPVRYTFSHSDVDAEEYNEEFLSLAKHRFESDKLVQLPWDAISYLNDNGFLYFLPMLLAACMQSEDYYIDRAMVALDVKLDLLRNLSARELAAVIDFLERLKAERREEIEENLDDEVIDGIVEKLNYYSNNAEDG